MTPSNYFIIMEIKQEIEQEIIELHNLFVAWFSGSSNKKELEGKLAARFYKNTVFITTKGESVPYHQLMEMFESGYGKMSSDFKIAISNVELLQDIGEYFLVNYIEWQTTDPNPELSANYNARKTTLLLSKARPFKWLHIHETMLTKPTEIIKDWKS